MIHGEKKITKLVEWLKSFGMLKKGGRFLYLWSFKSDGVQESIWNSSKKVHTQIVKSETNF